jgi:phosphate transport system permease protein
MGPVTDVVQGGTAEPTLFDPTSPLEATGNLRRRLVVNRVVESGTVASAVVAVAALAFITYTVAHKGASQLSFSFITQNPVGLVGGGIANYLIGTIVIVIFAAAIAVPIGVLCALYLTEVSSPRSRTGRALSFLLDLMQGLPTVIAGLFVFGLIVRAQGKETGWAASVALAIVMLPLIARSSQGVLNQVPASLREAADALGVERWRTVLGVILPSAIGGITTGVILAVARAAGETAPLLILNSIFTPNTTELDIFGHGVPAIPMLILTTSDQAVPQAFPRAWGAAFVLLVIILFANIGARLLLARSRAKMGT